MYIPENNSFNIMTKKPTKGRPILLKGAVRYFHENQPYMHSRYRMSRTFLSLFEIDLVFDRPKWLRLASPSSILLPSN